jgi:hypothetical protein
VVTDESPLFADWRSWQQGWIAAAGLLGVTKQPGGVSARSSTLLHPNDSRQDGRDLVAREGERLGCHRFLSRNRKAPRAVKLLGAGVIDRT